MIEVLGARGTLAVSLAVNPSPESASIDAISLPSLLLTSTVGAGLNVGSKTTGAVVVASGAVIVMEVDPVCAAATDAPGPAGPVGPVARSVRTVLGWRRRRWC